MMYLFYLLAHEYQCIEGAILIHSNQPDQKSVSITLVCVYLYTDIKSTQLDLRPDQFPLKIYSTKQRYTYVMFCRLRCTFI